MKPKSVCRGLVAIAILTFATAATSGGIVKYTRNDVACAALSDAEKKTQRDDMESFFFAETLKYLYVLLGPPNTINLKITVLNTEAHPLRRTW
jgi:mannosidase alpha-like ER degradation enhancer 2